MKSHMGGKQYKKALAAMQAMSVEKQKEMNKEFAEEDKSIAHKECKIQKFREILGDNIQETIEHLQKKQSRTAEEMAAEEFSDEEFDEEIEAEAEASDEEKDDRPIY